MRNVGLFQILRMRLALRNDQNPSKSIKPPSLDRLTEARLDGPLISLDDSVHAAEYRI